MNSSRLVRIPIDHVVAEVAAFPLASEVAFELRLTTLDPDLSPDTAKLWRRAEHDLLGSFPAFSVDEVVAIRDKIWFHHSQSVSPATRVRHLHVYLKDLACQFLERRGTHAVPQLPPDDRFIGTSHDVHAALARQRWRWLALALPPDLLLAALAPPDEIPETIELVSPTLARHLYDGTYRYSRYYIEKDAEARTLALLLRYNPLMLELVRGLDVCTDEMGVPNWVLVQLLAYLREAAEEVAREAYRLYGRSLPSLRMTAHAGEDFVHLLTGLRYVDEAVEYFPLRAGDRIGHGMALGVDPQEWAQHASRVPVLREERLFDLVWQWSWYGRQGGGPDRQRQHLLEYEIAEHSKRMFDEPVMPYDLELLRRALFTPDPRLWQEAPRFWWTAFRHRPTPADAALEENLGPDVRLWGTGFPNRNPPSGAALEKNKYLRRLYLYLRDPTLFERGREIVWVATSAQGEELAYLQAELRRKVGLRGITVEVNPTSNLLIGDLGDLTGHPLWRLRPPRPGSVDVPPVSICIGSDDPVVFGSDLRQEYQCLSDAMTLAGLSDEEVQQWLDRTRASGLESRFTLVRDNGSV
jgi:hypothetical protein